MSTAPRDGAHTRRDRLLDILSYIDRAEIPATTDVISSMMMIRHGLTRARVQQYLRELQVAHVIKIDAHGAFKLTQPLERVLAAIASAEPRDST